MTDISIFCPVCEAEYEAMSIHIGGKAITDRTAAILKCGHVVNIKHLGIPQQQEVKRIFVPDNEE